ncbi:MAG: stage 0 sporulation family protein [Oscillospiraceae bacterium]|nr:stage 0 sporulation family protein [Oscillospiraceae bacterium]
MNEKQNEVIGVRFKTSGKLYYFDPDGMQIEVNRSVIVETIRGIEYGKVVIANKFVDSAEIVSPLRKVLRIAAEEDEKHYEDNNKRAKEAVDVWNKKVSEHNMDMKLIDVEYTFDNSKLYFYFTADGRVDFRELVKDLVVIFRTRIELRQIQARDEAKIIGGLGVCGRSLCCKIFLNDFSQAVTIKMAKEQNLSLNSSKISGTCGKLMCCIRYENEIYEEELKKLPSIDSVVQTPDGDGIVLELNVLAGLVKVRSQANPELPPKVYKKNDIIKIKKIGRHEDAIDEDLKKLEKD